MTDYKSLKSCMPNYDMNPETDEINDDDDEENEDIIYNSECGNGPTICQLVLFLVFLVLFCLIWTGVISLNQLIPQSATLVNRDPDQKVHLETHFSNPTCTLDVDLRLDCDPLLDADVNICQRRGCCWQPTHQPRSASILSTPYCFYPSNNYSGYNVTIVKKSSKLLLLKLNRQISGRISGELDIVYVRATRERNDFMQIYISFTENPHKIESSFVFNPKNSWPIHKEQQSDDDLFDFDLIDYDNRLRILALPDRHVLWQADLNTLLYSNEFIQLDTRLNQNAINLYGLGDHLGEFRKKQFNHTRYTYWSRKGRSLVGPNLQSDHPAYLQLHSDQFTNVLALDSSYGVDVILRPGNVITWRSLGGWLRFLVAFGKTPLKAISTFQRLCMATILPPRWALGFQLVQDQFQGVQEMNSSLNKNLEQSVKVESISAGLQLFDQDRLFVIQKQVESELISFTKQLNQKHRHFGITVHPAVDGIRLDVNTSDSECYFNRQMVLSNPDGSPLRTRVLNQNWSSIVDYDQNLVVLSVANCLTNLRKRIPVETIELVLNRPDTLVDGSVDGCSYDLRLERPSYALGGWNESLSQQTVCMGSRSFNRSHFSLHNAFAIFHANSYFNVFISLNIRPFLIGGHYQSVAWGGYASAHTEYLNANWQHLQHSVTTLLQMSLFGVSMAGTNICGNADKPEIELCARWYSLGAFYPLSRTRLMANVSSARDPASLGPIVLNATHWAYQQRYSLLPTLYSSLIEASTLGTPAVRPLFLNYPSDSRLIDVDDKFMWSDKLLVVPVLKPNQTSITTYLPADIVWYKYPELEKVINNQTSGHLVTLESPLDRIPLLLAGGSVFLTQSPKATIMETAQGSLTLTAVLNNEGQANGSFYFDNGQNNLILLLDYTLIRFVVEENSLHSQRVKIMYKDMPSIDCIRIVGIPNEPKYVLLNGNSFTDYTFQASSMLVMKVDLRPYDGFTFKWLFD